MVMVKKREIPPSVIMGGVIKTMLLMEKIQHDVLEKMDSNPRFTWPQLVGCARNCSCRDIWCAWF